MISPLVRHGQLLTNNLSSTDPLDRSLAPSTSAPDDSETMKTLSIPLAIFFSIIDVGLANDTTLLRHRREEENLCFLYTEEDAEGICNAYYQQGCVENPTKDSCAKLAENFKKITDQSIPGSIPCETSLLSCRCIEEFDNFYDILSQLDEDSCTFDFGLAIDPPFFSLKVDQFGFETCSATVSAIRTQSLTFIGFCGTFIDQLNNFGPFPPLFPAELAACEEVLQCYSDYFGLEECISDGDGSC